MSRNGVYWYSTYLGLVSIKGELETTSVVVYAFVFPFDSIKLLLV